MKIESEIKQTTFTNEYQKAVINIVFTSSWINSENNRFLKRYDLTSQQFNVLRILRGQYPEPVSVQVLIERMIDKMSNASRLVEKLRQKELVQRKECGTDRRKVDVVITDKGLLLLEKIDSSWEEFEKNFKKISVDKAKELNNILDNFRG